MDARLSKKPAPAFAAGGSLNPIIPLPSSLNAENSVFVAVECRIKTGRRGDLKSTDLELGSWGKLWPRDAYMSGKLHIL